MSIPKVIHYCWFGKNPLPESVQNCIKSWKTYCPDYQIIEWNENNFDLSKSSFAQAAYSAKKWAFVSDYARVCILNEFGGIYLDTDVQLIKSLDPFMKYDLLFGFERDDRIMTALIGSAPNASFMKKIENYYSGLNFVNPDGSFYSDPNVRLFSTMFAEMFQCSLDGKLIERDNVVVFPCDFFSPKSFLTGKIKLTPNSCAIHHFEATWLAPSQKAKQKARELIARILGENFLLKLISIKRRFFQKTKI